MKERIGVLILEVPRLLRGILENAIGLHSDCELLNDTKCTFQHTIPPDIVILGLSTGRDATLVAALLARWPQAPVMTVSQEGADLAVYQLRPERRVLGQMSPAEIVETLREAVDRSRELPWEQVGT